MSANRARRHGGSVHSVTDAGSMWRQPKAVYAVAFACVIAFMGLGLVDPILPAIAEDLKATPSQVRAALHQLYGGDRRCHAGNGRGVELDWPKRTLLAGLALIVIFSGLAGSASGINGIVGFRAGWGLGNALFIATALAVIVGVSTGGVARAIILYEAALGLGISTGPLLGGLLGGISWKGPFYGVAVLMCIALISIFMLLPELPRPARHTTVLDPIRALRHRGLLTVGLTALCYNFGFFTLLGYAPFPLRLDAHGLGLVFFGWGVLLAITSSLRRRGCRAASAPFPRSTPCWP